MSSTSPAPPRKVLVIANRTCPCPGLQDEILRLADPPGSEVLVVAPALNSRLRHWVSDTDGAVAEARERLGAIVAGLGASGVAVNAEVGDAEPLTAIADALAAFEADELVLSTLPQGHSHWLERGLVERARDDFDVPVTHYVSRYGVEDGAVSTTERVETTA